MQLIGIGSFVLGSFQGLSRPLIHTDETTHTPRLVIIMVRRVLSGVGEEEVHLVNDSPWVKADTMDY